MKYSTVLQVVASTNLEPSHVRVALVLHVGCQCAKIEIECVIPYPL